MSFEQRTLCCNISVGVVIMCSAEMTVIIVAYLTKHPLMRCRSYNVSMVGGPHHSSFISQHRLCTTDRTLLAWIVAHLFINLCALKLMLFCLICPNMVVLQL
uniref:Secreted protein n=1 Tax=Angiostrongylus cantonensis TaxID=6313 RepID=A0A158P8Y8_ANGCA